MSTRRKEAEPVDSAGTAALQAIEKMENDPPTYEKKAVLSYLEYLERKIDRDDVLDFINGLIDDIKDDMHHNPAYQR